MRMLRLLTGLSLLAGLFVVCAGAVVEVSAGAVPACAPARFTGTDTVSTRPGGTTVRLVLTSHEFPKCAWSRDTGFRFLSAGASPVGPVVTSAPSTKTALVDDTFQVIENVSTMEGVRCTVKEASSVLVSSRTGANLAVRLAQPVGVCVNGATRWTTVAAPLFPSPRACTAAALKVSLGQGNGAAGTIYYPIVFTNVGATACSVRGVPSVQPTTGSLPGLAHIFVGPRARSNVMSSQGYGDTVRLAPGGVASASYGVSESGNYTPSACGPKNAQSLSIGLSDVGEWWLALKISVCTKLASTSIGGVVPSSTGYVG